jgi:hypothetical protein
MTTHNNIISLPKNLSSVKEVDGKGILTDYTYHCLGHKWTLWIHLPHDPSWTLDSYKKIITISTVEETIELMEHMPPNLIDNCMLFVMREGIKPTWEDIKNREGGCFSYKVSNKTVHTVWRNLFYILMGNSISNNQSFVNDVTGITISPKKNFCIIKIWLTNCSHQDPTIINIDCGLINDGCLFKKHVPEY